MSEAKTFNRPNVILYVTEKQRSDSCGCYGQEFATTPVLDELASQGIKFNNAFATFVAPVAMKANLLTGLEINQTKCFKNLSKLPNGTKTLAHVAQEQGYDTAFVGNWQLGCDDESKLSESINLEDRGGFNSFWRASHDLNVTSTLKNGGFVFDEQGNKVEFSGYRSNSMGDMALEFLSKRDHNRPFFMTICQAEAHLKSKEEQDKDLEEIEKQIEKDFAKQVLEKKIVSIPEKNELRSALRYRAMENYTIYEGYDEEHLKKFPVKFAPVDIQVLYSSSRRDIPYYLSQVNKLDENLGKLVQKLKDEGIYDNTVIIFTSLSGNHFNCRNKDKNFKGYDDGARSAHTNSSQVPLVIAGGAIKDVKEIEEIVSLESVAKTIAKLMGQEELSSYLGEDLLALDPQKEADPNKALYYRISESRVGRAIRTKNMIYSVCALETDGTESFSADKLTDDYMYDIDNDLVECNNLIMSYFFKDIKAQLRERLIALIDEHEHLKVTIEDAQRDKVEEDDRGGEGYREDEEVDKEQIEIAKRDLMREAKKKVKEIEEHRAKETAQKEAEGKEADKENQESAPSDNKDESK